MFAHMADQMATSYEEGMIVKEVGKGIQLLLSGSETMISAGVSGWALFGIASAISLLIGKLHDL